MERTERFYRIHALLKARRSVRLAEFLDTLEVSRATFKRDIEYLRDRMNVPIVWDRQIGGYRLESMPDAHELPGLWFSAQEAHALLAMHHMMSTLAPNRVTQQIAPLLQRLEQIIGSRGHSAEQVRQRIRILAMSQRAVPWAHFEKVSLALLERKQVHMRYHARGSDTFTERDVSPQRLVHYRDNWYLDAWCHLRDGLRSFAVDAIESAQVLNQPALDIEEALLDRHLQSGYGIFSGERVSWATLRFSAERARWVAAESWHPEQRVRFEADGSYLLEVPFADPRELAMDILKHGAEVAVLEPAALREQIIKALREALASYEKKPGTAA